MTQLKAVESPKGNYQLQGELNRNTIAKSSALALIEQSTKRSTKNVNSQLDISLDLLGVKHADTAGLAWLMNLLKASQQQNVQVKLKNIPDSLIKLAKISDVDSFLSVQ